jgi:hypothetical protein
MKRFFPVLLGILVLSSQGGWAAERPAFIRGVRPMGMGDAFTAVADDQNVFFYNPAGSVQRSGSLTTLLELPVIIGKDLLDAKDFIQDNEDDLSNFDSLTPQRQAQLINEMDRTVTKLDPRVGVGIINSHYISGPMGNRFHWGLGFFGQVEGGFRINTGIVPSLDYDINADAVPVLHFSKGWVHPWKFPGKVSAGVNLKYIKRGQVKDDRVSFLQLENFDQPPLQMGKGYGMDVGLLYQPTDRWNVGLTSLDFLGTKLDYASIDAEKGFTAKPSRSGTIKPRWNLGLAWTPARLGLPFFGLPTGNRLLLAMDIKDFYNDQSRVLLGDGFLPDTTWTHVYLGAEYRWWFLRVRGGANQGYPTFGLGLDIPFLKFDYAFFSDEKSRFAGSIKQSSHMLALAFRFGTGRTESQDRLRAGAAQAEVAPPVAPAAQPASDSAPVEQVPEPASGNTAQ